MLRWLNRFQVKASVEMLGEIKPLSYLYWNKESVTRTQCSTIWTFLRRQSEDPKDHNTHWVLHRICYDSGTAKLMVNFQVIRGLRTTRDRIVRLFYWKDVLYCRSAVRQEAVGTEHYQSKDLLLPKSRLHNGSTIERVTGGSNSQRWFYCRGWDYRSRSMGA